MGVPLYPWYGGTEFGPHTKIFDIAESEKPAPSAKTREDWEWMAFTERVKCRWDPQGDGTYELHYLVSFFETLYSGESYNRLCTDVSDPSSERGEPGRHERICYQRSVGTASDEERALAHVRNSTVPIG